MLFGNPGIFAVQVDLEADGPFRDCRIVYWIEGRRYGDPEQPVEVLGVLGYLAPIVKDGGRRADAALDGLSDPEAFAFLYDCIFDDKPHDVLEMPARFRFIPPLEPFKDCTGFAVERDGAYHLLLGDGQHQFDRTRCCPVVDLEDALFDAYMYLNKAVPMRD